MNIEEFREYCLKKIGSKISTRSEKKVDPRPDGLKNA